MDQDFYIKKWLDGTLTEAEKKHFEQSEDFKDIQKLDQAIQNFKAPSLEKSTSFDRLNLEHNVAKEVPLNWWKPLLRVAAVLIAGVCLYVFWPGQAVSFQTVTTDVGQTTEFTLPDQSEVFLNASSTISYQNEDWTNNRALDLNGEAYFKVAKGAKFTVKTPDGVVSVLGTEFNVKTRGNYFEVICYEGLVQITAQDLDQQLPAAHMLRIINGTVLKESNLADKAPSWINFKSSFASVPYGEVLREFERQYQVIITSSDLDLSQLFSGSFTHKDIDLALKSITQPLNLGYQIKDNQTVILTSETN